jgi:ABC-type lipoprotein release transport system permease subunit
MSTTIRLAWRNMWRNWRRTAIALIAIVLGVILLLFLDGFIHGSDQAVFGNAVRLYGGNIQVHAVGYKDKAARVPLMPLENTDVILQVAHQQPQENITQGRFLLADDGDAILIGQGLADRLQAGVGDRVALLGRSKNEMMRQHAMTVVGIYDLHMPEAEKSMVFIPLADAQTLYNLRDQATEVAIFLKKVGTEMTVMSALQARLPGYEVDSWHTQPDVDGSL